MTHHSIIKRIAVDVSPDDHDQELSFWERALDQELPRGKAYPEFHGADLEGLGIGLIVQRLGGGSSRVHLDIHSDDVGAEVARLEKFGAEVVDTQADWTVMRDPAGLPFCVVADDSLDDSNSRTWS